MNIADILSSDAVCELRDSDKSRVLKELTRKAAALVGADAATITTAVADREGLGSTGLGNGVALPHARITGLDRPFGAFAHVRPAVEFDAIDEHPVDLLFLLLLPAQHPELQLKALACVARRLRDPVLTGKLRAARGRAALHGLLIDAR